MDNLNNLIGTMVSKAFYSIDLLFLLNRYELIVLLLFITLQNVPK